MGRLVDEDGIPIEYPEPPTKRGIPTIPFPSKIRTIEEIELDLRIAHTIWSQWEKEVVRLENELIDHPDRIKFQNVATLTPSENASLLAAEVEK